MPLILIFPAAYFGVSARTLVKLAARHTATAMLAMFLLFVASTVYVVSISLRILTSG